MVIRLPRVRIWVPNLIDRYVFRVFTGVFALVLLSGLSIYLVADLTGKADEIMKNHVPRSVVLQYYKYSSLQMFYEISPILVLVATLITFSLLSKSNEVIAFKALGVSLFRLAVPAVAAALAITIFTAFLESEVLPASNEKVARLEDRIRGRETARTYRRADRQWLFGQDRYIYNYIHYDPDRKTLHRLQVFEFDPDTHRARRAAGRPAGHLRPRRLVALRERLVAELRGQAGHRVRPLPRRRPRPLPREAALLRQRDPPAGADELP